MLLPQGRGLPPRNGSVGQKLSARKKDKTSGGSEKTVNAVKKLPHAIQSRRELIQGRGMPAIRVTEQSNR